VFREDLNLNAEIQIINEKLALSDDFEVVDGLTTFREPDNYGLAKVLAIAFLASFVGGYVFLGLWKFNKYLAKIGAES
jgi:hypothetical protein